jgi:hypothetical protein
MDKLKLANAGDHVVQSGPHSLGRRPVRPPLCPFTILLGCFFISLLPHDLWNVTWLQTVLKVHT